jgi:Tol biopolymer transport system component
VKASALVFLAVALLWAPGDGHGQRAPLERFVDDYTGSFSPDGKMIVFERFFSTSRRGVDTHPVPKRAVLLLMRADGSRKRVLRHAGARFEHDASFSADGRSIVLVRDERIHVMRADGTGARRVRRDLLDQACPRFSPEGRRISFWRGRTAKSGAYFVMDAGGTDLRRIVAVGDEPAWGCPSWFPDGRRVVFAKGYHLYAASVDGTGVKRITRGRLDTFYRPSISPDGRWIACDGFSNRLGYGIFVLRADGSDMRKITTSANEIQNDSGPAWSPDGKRILFSGYRGRFEGRGVYVVNRDGRGLRRLSNLAR